MVVCSASSRAASSSPAVAARHGLTRAGFCSTAIPGWRPSYPGTGELCAGCAQQLLGHAALTARFSVRCARNHVLVVPHVHIPDVNSLAADAPPVDPYSGPWGDAPVGLDGSGDGGAAAGAEQPDEADGAHRASGETGDTPMSHRKLVQHMRSVGAELLRRADEAQGIEHDPAGCVYRFHVPPFNSIAHSKLKRADCAAVRCSRQCHAQYTCTHFHRRLYRLASGLHTHRHSSGQQMWTRFSHDCSHFSVTDFSATRSAHLAGFLVALLYRR